MGLKKKEKERKKNTSVLSESRQLGREHVELSTTTVVPADLAPPPKCLLSLQRLALSGSHIFLDDKLIKLDFLDEMDTKELQLPKGLRVNTTFWL
jgi:hypothetical protein